MLLGQILPVMLWLTGRQSSSIPEFVPMLLYVSLTGALVLQSTTLPDAALDSSTQFYMVVWRGVQLLWICLGVKSKIDPGILLSRVSLQIKKKMTREEFVKNNRGINGTKDDPQDLPQDFLNELYTHFSEKAICFPQLPSTLSKRMNSASDANVVKCGPSPAPSAKPSWHPRLLQHWPKPPSSGALAACFCKN